MDKERYTFEFPENFANVIYTSVYDKDKEKTSDMNMIKMLDLLNQQDRHIKELEEENKQLKQSQKELEISELEKLKDFFLEPYRDEEMGTEFLITTKNTGNIADYVLDRIKELKGEE